MNPYTKKQLLEWTNFAQELAVEAGDILLRAQKKIHQLSISKKDKLGVASTADLKSENHIIKCIRRSYPEHLILAEEDSYFKGLTVTEKMRHFKDEEYTWMIDPLDGTNNFLASFNYYSVCIALAYRGEPIVGVVFRPETGELFRAHVGGGAYKIDLRKNAKKSKIYIGKNSNNLADSIFVTGFAAEKKVDHLKEYEIFKKVMKSSRGVRRLGSAALDMIHVAQGIFDGFWEFGLAPWDVAAASVICFESGVKITDIDGKAFCPFDSSICVARAPIMTKLRKIIK